MQQVLVAQALYRELGKVVSTKGDGLRSQVDAEVLDWYAKTGAKSFDVNIGGQKVGTYSVTVSKPKSERVYDLEDAEAFEGWLASDEGLDAANGFLGDHTEQFVREYAEGTGTVPPGVAVRTVETPAHAKGTVVRPDAAKLARALGGELPTVIAGLLGGGE